MCDIIPDVEVKVDIFVEDEGEIAENDLVTIKVFYHIVSYRIVSCHMMSHHRIVSYYIMVYHIMPELRRRRGGDRAERLVGHHQRVRSYRIVVIASFF